MSYGNHTCNTWLEYHVFSLVYLKYEGRFIRALVVRKGKLFVIYFNNNLEFNDFCYNLDNISKRQSIDSIQMIFYLYF